MPMGEGGGEQGSSPSLPDRSGRLSALLRSFGRPWFWPSSLPIEEWRRVPSSASSPSSSFMPTGKPRLKWGEKGGRRVGVFPLAFSLSVASSLWNTSAALAFKARLCRPFGRLGIPMGGGPPVGRGPAGPRAEGWGISDFFGLPRFFFPVTGSMGLEPFGSGLPNSSTRLRLGAGILPSGRGLGGRPRLFFPVRGSIRSSPSIASEFISSPNSSFFILLLLKFCSFTSGKTTSDSSSSWMSPRR